MSAPKPAKADPAPKPKSAPGKARKPGGPDDRYDDEITKATIESLNKMVPDEDFDDFKPTTDRAW